MKHFKLKFLLLFFALAMAIPPAWAETVSTTILSTTQDGSTLTWSNNSLTFSLTQKPSSVQYSVETASPARGLGTGSKTGTHVLTSDQSFEGVTTVEVIASTNGSDNTISVSAGDDEIGTAQTIASGTANANNTYIYQSTNPCSGKIVITINDVNKSVWIKSITVTYQEGGNEPTENLYKKVTSDDQIVAGKKYILVAGNYAMGAVVNQSTAPGVEVTIENNTIDIAGTEVAEYVLSEEHFSYGNSWGYNLILNGQSIGYAGSGKFGMVETPSLIQYYWTFISSSNGYTVRNSDSDYKAYSIRMLTSSHVFAPYKQADSNTIAYLYVQEGSEQPVTPPSLSVDLSQLTLKEGGGSFNVTGTNLVDNVGVTQNPEGLFNLTFTGTGAQSWGFERNSGNKVNGTVNLEYTGRELYVTGTIIPGTDPYENAPDEEPDLTAPVTVTYQPDVYLYGDFGGGWGYPEDAQFDYANGVYSQTVSCDNTFFIMFARKAGENYNWQDNRYFFSAKKTNYWTDEQGNAVNNWVYNKDECNELELSTSGGQYHCIQLPAGEYKITINAAEKTFSILSSSVNNLTDANKYPTGETFTFNGRVVVTHRQGKNLWIRDVQNRDGSTTAGYIYSASNGADFEPGDVINAGWTGKRTVYNGLDEFTGAAGLEKDGEADFAPEVLTAINANTDVNKYVEFKGVSEIVDTDGNKVELRDQFSTGFSFAEGKIYDITGIVSYYNKLQFYPISFTDVTPAVLTVTLESDTKTAVAGETIPVTVNIENAVGDYVATYKIGAGAEQSCQDGDVINITSETPGDVTLTVNVLDGNGAEATATETYSFEAPLASEFVLLTDITKLEDGKQIIIADKNTVTTTSVLSTNQKTNNRGVVNLTVAEGLKITANAQTEIITLKKSGDNWYLKARRTAGYLYAPGGDNYLRTASEITDAQTASISLTEDGDATIEFNTSATQRFLRYNSGSDLFSCYKPSNTQNPVYIYIEKSEEPPLAVTLPDAPAEHYKVGQVVKVKATVENGSENTVLTYTVGEETLTADTEGNVTLPNKKAGDVVLTVTAVDGDKQATDSKTYVFDAADALNITLTPATGTYYVGDVQNVTVTVEGAIATNPTITYKFGEEGEAQNYDSETGIVLPTNEAGTINLIVMVDDDGYEHAGETTATGNYTVNYKALTITLDPENAEFNVGDGDDAKVKVTIENAVGTPTVTCKVGDETLDLVNGYVTLPDTKAGEVTLTVTAKDEREGAQEVVKTGTYTFTAAPAFEITLTNTPDKETYEVNDVVNVKVAVANALVENPTITYTIGETREATAYDPENGINVTSATAGTVRLTVNVTDGYEHAGESTKTADYVFEKKDVTLAFGETPENVYNGNEITLTVTGAPEGATVTFECDPEGAVTFGENGKVTFNTEGPVTITAKTAETDEYEAGEVSMTFNVQAKTTPTMSFGDQTEFTLTIGDDFTAPTLTGVPEGGNVTYESSNSNVATVDADGTVHIVGIGEAKITATYAGNNQYNSATTSYTITVNDVVVALAAPTFSPKAGTYTEAKEVAIACATPGVTIEYTIDGVTKTYDGPFTVDHSCTVTATAKKGTRTVYTPATNSATYTINAVPAAEIADKFYYLQNNALSGKYANVAGRRTLNFVDNADEQAGTVFRVETGADGAVKTLRSQAVDLQGYANRAMAYVPKAIEFVLSTLNNASDVDDATGAGNILGENGVQLILKKFYENFDYNLYVESTEGAYRIYGRTPSMQHVVDFYHENTAQVEEKLPMLEDYINQVIAKIRSKVPAGMNANVFEDFSLVKVWEKMGGKLIKPEGAENVMAFYRQVLNNKEYVWDFAYQTAMIYLDNIKGTQTYQSIPDEYKAYVEKMQNIRPETKYYMIQNGNEPDYVSENNTKIINNDPSTLWTLTERQTFTVSFPEANLLNGNYYTTLYTDFAYDVPEGVTAYKVTGVNSNAIAEIEAIGKNVPAQTPVLLMTAAAKANVTKTVTLNTNDGTPIENELKGPDYLIKTYEITAPTVESLFAMAAGIVPADMLAQYEYLKLRTSGTVNNKYMWGLSNDDINKCSYLNANNENDCVVRSLDAEEGTVAFSDHWTVATNKAFLVSETNDVIYLSMDTVAEPTFSPVPGSYTAEQQVTITCATEEATIKYSTDGGQTWNTYEGPIAASDDMTIVAKAEKNGMIASNEVTAVYVIDLPTELPDVPAMKGYYQIKNNGNEMYAHVQGRKTLTFTDAPADKAGTVIWLETNDKGQVQSIRSQAADLQGYANRAMNYVPDIVELVADKLKADGVGNLLGHEGLEKIMEKFNESFDHHLYVEQAGENGWRLYGKTPSMQPVVDFYRENTAQVEAKLPMLEDFINSALDKLKEKIGGSSVFTPFSLHQIWENMGGTLTEPNDDASIMAFYREVLNNKNYVWDFAYQTAMIYVNNLKNPRYNEVEDMLGEYAQYINMIEQVRPDFKYYIVQKNDKPDFISEGNVDITKNAARTIWTLEPRTEFNVSIAENLFGCPLAGGVGGYATTLYTDFAYSVPDGVTAYKVTSIEGGNATIEALSGVIPAQTPVLLTAKEAGTATLTLSTEAGTAVTGNLLVGPDYLINEYDLKTEQIQGLFDMIKDKLGQSFYDAYIAQYEHLADLNSGTVNNKYFWGLKESDVEKCSNDGGENCVVRNLEGGKFIDNWKVETNKAFLVTDEYAEITMSILHGDVNHDGKVNIQDVTDLIDRRLVRPDAEHLVACEYCSDVNQDGKVDIQDVTDLIDILLGNGTDTTVPDEGEGDGN